MGKYVGTLHKLIDGACASNSKKKWDQVIFYLQGHTVKNQRARAPEFESPLPPNVVPSPDLECELFDPQGPKKEDTPLRIAIKEAPANVVAALCHLGPEAVSLVDSRQRLPIHWACRRSSEDPETDKILYILIECYQEGLLHRDDGGRTPLHWLFWYHARSRKPEMVQCMCQELPYDWFLDIVQERETTSNNNSKEQYQLPPIPRPSEDDDVPQSAAIIADSKHGALPLHYAVMQGTSKEALKALIQQYPKGIAMGDRRGRSALAWYLGAGSLLDAKKHICGEANDPNATPWWHTKLSLQYIQMLISSKVARLEDSRERVPLHWACHFFARNAAAGSEVAVHKGGPSISNKIFQILLDNNIAAVTHQDIDGKTPLHVMFSVVASIQESEHQRLVANRSLRHEIDLNLGGPPAFQPPKPLLELLLKSPDIDGQDYFSEDGGHGMTAAYLEDENGLLPLHTALRAATSLECVQLLIQANPTSLVHTSEEQMQTPLVHAYCSEFSAPLQPAKILETLMAAYVTSRHGTYMDGRLALKMEDAYGKFPIHYACQNQASFQTIKMFVEKFNRCAIFQNADGDLPIHSLLSRDFLFDSSESGVVIGASLAKPLGLLSEQELKRQQQINDILKLKMRILLEPLKLPEHLKIASSAHGMTPLHVAVAFNVLPYDRLYRMIDAYPEAAKIPAKHHGNEYSPLQLHDRLEHETKDAENWQGVRELLYSFDPSVDTHRRNEELLDACVKLIRSEMLGHGSYHLQQLKDHKLKAPMSIDLTETLSAINAPNIDTARRPKSSRPNKIHARQGKRQSKRESSAKVDAVGASTSSSFGDMIAKKLDRKGSPKKKNQSIYDDDLDNRYVVSPQNSVEGDEYVDDFDESSAEEEYYSDEEMSETDEGSNLERLESASWEDNMESGSMSESVSQTVSQALSSVVSGSFASNSRSLLRKAISSSVSEDMKTNKPAIFEEKKEAMPNESMVLDEGVHLSEVAKRLWCFFVGHNDPKDPSDNYLPQVEAVLEDVEFDIAEQLIDLALPSYATEYLQPGVSPLGLTMRDIASPKVKELFESYYYFVGRYEFPSDVDGILIHRSADCNTLWVRATEHVVQTTEYEPAKILDPGTAEEAIWKTGEVIHDEPGYLASRFKDKKRPVFFKLTKSSIVFENEVKSREEMGIKRGDESHFLPLLSYLDKSGKRKADRRFKLDSNEERFRTLHLYGGEKVSLSDFPFALVYPLGEEGDLFDYFYHRSADDLSDVAAIVLQVGKALQSMHDKGVVHGGLSMRSISMPPFDNDDPHPQRKWVISDLSRVRRNNKSSFLGSVSSDGTPQFETGLMPPEMFTKLSTNEEEICKQYWDTVEAIYGIKVDRQVVEPFIDSRTGCSYTLRCHYTPAGRQKKAEGELPELPYMLVPARESTDIWCFGVMLYCMCSNGRPLIPTNIKSGHLLENDRIVHWSRDLARAAVYEHVNDPVAQDILLQLLTSYESRNNLDLRTVLSHPFFSKETSPKTVDKLIEQRQNDSAVYMRNRTIVVHEKSEDDWLKSRSVIVHCWNFDILKTFHYSSSEIIRRLTGKDNAMPSTFLLLPYKLSAKNKKAKLAPTTKKDVERAERTGVLFLLLAKACHFGAMIDQTIKKSSQKTKWDAISLLESATFPSGDFEDLKEEFSKIAAERIEEFRSNPTTAVIKLIEKRYFEIRLFFKDAGKSYLYLVDEYMGVPLVGSEYEPYPLEISDSVMSKMLTKVLPFMHCCSMVVRGVSGSVSGIVRLIFEAAYPHVPPSWATAASGLPHVLDEEMIRNEVLILHQTLCDVNNSKSRRSLADDLAFLRDSCTKADVKNDFATMKRVQCGGSSMWTTPIGLEAIQEACENFGFKQALEIQSALESKLKTQDDAIRQLQEKIEWLSFRKELNLKMPVESSLSTHSASVTRKMDNTGYNSSVSSHSGVQRGEVASPSFSSTHSTPRTGAPKKHTNALAAVSPRKSLISPRSKASRKTGSSSAHSHNSDSFFPDDEPDDEDPQLLDKDDKSKNAPDDSTVGSKETFRDLLSVD